MYPRSFASCRTVDVDWSRVLESSDEIAPGDYTRYLSEESKFQRIGRVP